MKNERYLYQEGSSLAGDVAFYSISTNTNQIQTNCV